MRTHNPAFGLVLAFLGATCFSFSDMTAKWLSQTYPIVQILFLNSLAATAALLLLSRFMRGSIKQAFKPHYPRLLALRSAFVVAVGILNFYAFSQMPLSNAYALLFTGPIMACLLSIPMLKERVLPMEWLFAGLGFIGVLIIVQPGIIGLSLASLSALVGAFCVASMNNLARRMGDKDTPFTIAFIPVLVSIPTNFLIMISVTTFVMPSFGALFLFLFSGSMVAVGFFLLAKAYTMARVAVVSPMAYTQMVWSLILDYLLFSETPGIMMLIGVVIIIACGIGIMRFHRNKPVLT